MLLLYKPLGVGGITLATSLVSLVNFFALMFLLGPRIGGVDARRVAWSAARSIVALVPLAVVAYAVWWASTRLSDESLWAQIVSVGLAYVAGGLAYCLAAWAMRMPELRDVVSGGPAPPGAAVHRGSGRAGAGWIGTSRSRDVQLAQQALTSACRALAVRRVQIDETVGVQAGTQVAAGQDEGHGCHVLLEPREHHPLAGGQDLPRDARQGSGGAALEGIHAGVVEAEVEAGSARCAPRPEPLSIVGEVLRCSRARGAA